MEIRLPMDAVNLLHQYLSKRDVERFENRLGHLFSIGLRLLKRDWRSLTEEQHLDICGDTTVIVISAATTGRLRMFIGLADGTDGAGDWDRPLCAFFFQTLRHLARRFSDERRRRREEPFFESEHDVGFGTSVLDCVADSEELLRRLKWLDEQMNSGNFPYLTLMLEKEMNGFTHRESAFHQGLSEAAGKARYQRTIESLRKSAEAAHLTEVRGE